MGTAITSKGQDDSTQKPVEDNRTRLIAAGGLQALAKASSLKVLFGLRGLTTEKQRVRATELAEKCGISKNTVGPAVSRLQRSGLIERNGKSWELSRPADPSPVAETIWELVDALADVAKSEPFWLLSYAAIHLLTALAALDVAGVATFGTLAEICGLSEKTIGRAVRELMADNLLRGRVIKGVGLEYTLIPPEREWSPSAATYCSQRLTKRLKQAKVREKKVRGRAKEQFCNELRATEDFVTGEVLRGLSTAALAALDRLTQGRSRPSPESRVSQELEAAGLVAIRVGHVYPTPCVKGGFTRLHRSLPGWMLARRSAKKLYVALRQDSSAGTTAEISDRSGVEGRWINRLLAELSLLKWIDAEHDGQAWRVTILEPPTELPAAAVVYYLDQARLRRQRIEAMIERLKREVGAALGRAWEQRLNEL